MPFSAHDLRYHLNESYPVLYAYLQHRARRFLGALSFDAFEVDQVVGHVVEHLTKIQLLGGGDWAPLTALDALSEAQFYAFLNRMLKNKSIDRMRRRRLPLTNTGELEALGNPDEENDPLNAIVEPLWGDIPFATPEEAVLEAATQENLRLLLKNCIRGLGAAPRQLQAIMQELEELGAEELIHDIREEFQAALTATSTAHISQHKDHAHKKLRHCLQKSSSNLAVMVAIRLTEYGHHPAATDSFSVPLETLAQHDLSLVEVQTGLQHLAHEGLLDWQGETTVRFTLAQQKLLSRFYEEGEG